MRVDKKGLSVDFSKSDLRGKRLVISKKVTGFGDNLMGNITWLAYHPKEKIEVEEGNPVFYMKEGCLIDRTTKTLVLAEIGAKMLDSMVVHKDNALVKAAYKICRWHHERYDGRGYPDGLKGDEIPISAQIVSIADVYDALTSERCYKKAFTHEKALEMILNGECGTFNPILLECLMECAQEIRAALESKTIDKFKGKRRSISKEVKYLTKEVLKDQNIV